MNFKLWLGGGIMLATTVPTHLPQAKADVYYAVEPGETLVSIASHYKTRPEVLRNVNNLPTVKDNDALSSMLLRIPEKSEGNPVVAPVEAAPVAAAPIIGYGTIASSVSYPVVAGDTLASIAAGFAKQGFPVTADAIRERNRLKGEPVAGTSLVVPLQSAIYRAAASEPASHKVDNANTSYKGATTPDVEISGEIPATATATVVEHGDSIYQSPNHPKAMPRGSALSSRAYYPGANSSEGVRVLSQNEEAANSAPSPRTNAVRAPGAGQLTMAQVAEVAEAGARIRRLPQASAVTLYNCPIGTQLAVTKKDGMWSAVLMSDRSTGWVPTHYLKLTGAEIDAASLSGGESGSHANDQLSYNNGNYSSSNPMVQQALRWLGTPYVYGGTSHNGIDCSSLVQQSFAACGSHLPRTAAEQANVGQPVDPSDLQAGDRLYFSASGSRVDHTGLYMGNGLFVHASGHGRRVMVSSLYEPRNWNIFVGARR